MLITRNLRYKYDNSPTLSFPDMTCQKGEQWLLLGQSGSGKTTLLHLLGGLLAPQSGDITLGDTRLTALSNTALDRFRGRNIGIIFQTAHFVKALTVEENLLLAQELAGVKTDKTRIRTLLDQLNLAEKRTARTDELSVGEQQRVNIIRAVIHCPQLILADEPTSALDDINAKEVITLLENQAREAEALLLIVTHDGRLKDYFTNQIHLTA